AVGLSTIRAICEAALGVVVVDEAYHEFARTGTPSALQLLPDYPRLAVSRTMSKAFAFAAGRLGYLAAAPAFIEALRIVRLPYHLSALTQAAARVALAHAPEMLAKVDQLRDARDDLASWLAAQGLQVAESDANFVLFGRFTDRPAGGGGWGRLLDRGVLIREPGPDGWLRVSAGTPAEMQTFKDALAAVLENEIHKETPRATAEPPPWNGRPRSRRSGSASISTAQAGPRSRQGWDSSTTC